MRWLRLRALLLANLVLFFCFLIGLAVVGHAQDNSELTEHGQAPQTFAQYVGSSSFGEAVFENWESEFLQMFMYVLLTAYLVQKGSAESRPIDEPAPQDEDPRDHRSDRTAPWPVRHGSELILRLYENSLAIAFGLVFLLSFWLHAATGAATYSEEELQHGGTAVTTWQYLGTSQFWYESLQNWQSEFLAVAAIIGGSIYLRQRRSAQSKPVHAPHSETGG
ncbi:MULTISPECIES: DUF6766 family protein [Kribbella]|uniref:Uncharacterized protein n=1 Tax=Kribbella pratensis TaxID=2512112 RepID=A0ABY2FJP5_9ACTN|nr:MULTISPECIES: DUF6766 family protein [Kribbella]TDW86588.1 hypothetical protein EV647_6685 [Kribbella sp. VKM Ac-2566]TDW93343.1 hypothetical protein EV137_0618 [Kribbella pratensis]